MNERRARRKPGENRARLLEAGLIEFGLFGYHGASTSSIAERAGVPQPHVYANFGSKKDLFVACLGSVIDDTELLALSFKAETSSTAEEVNPRCARFSLFIFQATASVQSTEVRETVAPLLHKLAEILGAELFERSLVLGGRLLLGQAQS